MNNKWVTFCLKFFLAPAAAAPAANAKAAPAAGKAAPTKNGKAAAKDAKAAAAPADGAAPTAPAPPDPAEEVVTQTNERTLKPKLKWTHFSKNKHTLNALIHNMLIDS